MTRCLDCVFWQSKEGDFGECLSKEAREAFNADLEPAADAGCVYGEALRS